MRSLEYLTIVTRSANISLLRIFCILFSRRRKDRRKDIVRPTHCRSGSTKGRERETFNNSGEKGLRDRAGTGRTAGEAYGSGGIPHLPVARWKAKYRLNLDGVPQSWART
jgi:hypothetical protein